MSISHGVVILASEPDAMLKSYVSFQQSGQIRNSSPNGHQFYHERPMTIFNLIFKKLPKSKQVWLPCLKTKKGMLVQSMIKKTHGFES